MNWIDEYLEAFTNAVSASSEAGWFPFSAYRFFPYTADMDLARWHQVLTTAKEKNIPISTLAKTMHGPLAIRMEIHLAIFESKIAQSWETSSTQAVVNFLNDICLARCVSDPYGLKKAQIHTPEEVENISASTPWQSVSGTETRTVGNAIMAAIQLAYAYYIDYCYCPWFEAQGPYDLPDSNKLIIRTFGNFHPQEVWPQGPFPKCKRLEIYTAYKASEIIIDQWSHISSHVNLAQNLLKVAFKIDEQWTPLTDIPTLTDDMGTCAAILQNRWRKFDFETAKQRVMELRWYQYQSMFALLGLPWQPTIEMRRRIKGVPLLPEMTPEFTTTEDAKKWWHAFADPKINNFPNSYIKPWEKNI